MEEIWKDIPGYEGKYQVSNIGRVKSIVWKGVVKDTIFTPWKSRYGYLMVSLRDGINKKGFGVHRLVYEAFLGPIPPGMQVNHINEDKTDNRLENLNLLTPKANCNWGTRNKRIGNQVAQLDKDGKLVNLFDTANDAERELSIFATSIVSVCKGHKCKTAGGYKWKYVKDIHPFVLRLLKDVYILTPLFANQSSSPSSCTRT